MKIASVRYITLHDFLNSSLKNIDQMTQFEISEQLHDHFRRYRLDAGFLVLVSVPDLVKATEIISSYLCSEWGMEYAGEIALTLVEDIKSLDQSVMIAVES